MAVINILTFQGERPRVTPRLLANEQATVAKNTQFERATLLPYNQPLLTGDSVTDKTKTLFRYLGLHWFEWNKVVDAVYSPVANDVYQRVYYTGDDYPKVTNNAIFGGPVKPYAFYRLGVPAGTTAINGKVIPPVPLPPDDDANDNETRFYTYTYVSGSGEEGAPGPASNQLEISYPGSEVELTIPDVITNNSDITKVRIYRSATGGGEADFYFVAELPIATLSYTDKLADSDLGPVLITDFYEMPNEKMRHLTLMSNGILAGAWENTVAFCEPYTPYAWPTEYQLTTEHNVVAMQAVGNNLLVATEGYPWIFYGVTSDAMTPRKIESSQACVSKRSMANIGGIIMYASPDGLVGFNGETVQLMSAQVFTRKQWSALKPETIQAYYYEGMYLAFYGDDLDKAFLYSPGGGDVIFFDIAADCAVSDLLTDTLYMVKDGAISKWNEGAELEYTWRSKEYYTLDGVFNSAYIRGDVSDVGLRIIIDGKIAYEFVKGKIPPRAFRLPSLRGRVWQFELFGTTEVLSICVATSMAEIVV
ncbi:internal virion protein [Vibrio phage douglas 12A4]|uniref:internal virion protein n=1 Tax=Vibrio phage douglas 12A4 TaxID=573171 RepID=UPI0002C0C477|nr:internal virion protein [Vibrio phage douglas 12A4]AGG58104.1 hypothetical protein VPAG_00068 [Vibrio phage douglas 12A4]